MPQAKSFSSSIILVIVWYNERVSFYLSAKSFFFPPTRPPHYSTLLVTVTVVDILESYNTRAVTDNIKQTTMKLIRIINPLPP